MKRIVVFIFLALSFLLLLGALMGHFQSRSTRERLRIHAEEALAYCKYNHLSTDYCFLVDFDIHSGKERFFVWDFNQKKWYTPLSALMDVVVIAH
ncbi:MAG: murein L,D-transpeptidase catalytic domain family protein [Elusimicrobiaceae bacterium]|nr:murein L,D-transpeptidase catalytic domain family protein [Elusimicrobiaceae bacterium]